MKARKGKFHVVRTTRTGKVVETNHTKRAVAIRMAKASIPTNRPFQVSVKKQDGTMKRVATVNYIKVTPKKKSKTKRKRNRRSA